MKKKLLLFVLVLSCISINKNFAQVINEGFEEAEWGSTVTSNSGSVVITGTSANSTMTYFLSSAGSSSSFSTTGAYTLTVPFLSSSSPTNSSSTRTSYTVHFTSTDINTSPNSGSWLYSRGSIATDSRLQRAHSKTNSWAMGSSSGYLITPVISGGVASITVWVAAPSNFTIGLNTNTNITSLPTYSSNNSAAMAGFTQVTQSFPASGTLGSSYIQSFSFTGSFSGPVRVGLFNAGGSNIYIDDIIITSPAPTTALFSSPTSLSFANQQSSTNSTSQSFDLSGTLLTGFPSDLTVSAPSTDFQVSNNNTTWGSSATIAYTSETLAVTPVYIRFTPQTTGAKSGNVTVAGGGATTINIAVSGTGTGPIYSFRSKQSGNWADASTWEYNNGTIWVNAVTAPIDADGTINIQNAHVVTVNAPVSVDELTIDAGGELAIATTNTLTIANGTGTDITVNGKLKNSGILTLTGTLAFGATGTYQHDVTTAIPTLTWAAGSTCLVTGGTGVPSGGFGQSFANLTWNCENQTGNVVIATTGFTVTGNFNVISTGTAGTGGIQMISSGGVQNSVVGSYTQSGGYVYIYPNNAPRSMTCNGDFTMTGGNFGITGSVGTAGTGSATLFVKGNIQMGNGATISRTTGTTANFELNGSSAQTIMSSATIDIFNTNFNNAAGITLLAPIILKGNVTFTNGLVNTTSTNLLTISGNATVSGGSSTSFVNGPLQRSLDITSSTSLVLPIGKGTAYSPVTLTITQDAATSTNYTAEVFLGAPTSNTLPPTLSKVSDTRYYNIFKDAGANVTAAQVQLDYDAVDASITGVSLADKATIRIAKDNGSGSWLNLGSATGGSANTSGTIISDVNFTDFSQFAIANASAVVPVKFVSFNALLVNDKTKLTWQVANEINIASYEVEKAVSANNFVAISQQAATGSNLYTSMDELPITGTNLYRIKAIEKDGHVLYSITVKVTKGKANQMDLQVMPNPVKDKQLNIKLVGYEKGNYSFILYNASGILVYSKQQTVSTGSTIFTFNLPTALTKGIYQLVVTNGSTKIVKSVSVE